MTEGGSKIFSLKDANELIPLLSEITADIVKKLDEVRERHRADSEGKEIDVPEGVLKEVEETLRRWSDEIEKLGAYPKGYFTVDFQSFDPELLYCWTYGEEEISYTHKVWENFTHRKPMAENVRSASDHMKWIH